MNSQMNAFSRRDIVYLVLAGIFITDALLGELTGSKLIHVGPFTMSIGIIPWPVVFLTTDIVNEYYGRAGVKRLTLITAGLIASAFLVLYAEIHVPAASFSPVQDEPFAIVFGQSLWMIVASLTAFLVSQLIDVIIFWRLRARTGGRHLWLRATGSTAISQLIDTFIVAGIAFWLTGKISTHDYIVMSFTNYTFKLGIAIALTPLIYLAHGLVGRYLGHTNATALEAEAARASLASAS